MIWGIVNIGDAKQLGTIGKKLIIRFLSISTLFGVVSMAAALAVFRIPLGGAQSGQAVVRSVVEMLLDMERLMYHIGKHALAAYNCFEE